MDQATWDRMSEAERECVRDLSELSPQLVGLEGWRVEVQRREGYGVLPGFRGDIHRDRFIVGRSTGWTPIHVELRTRRSISGMAADRKYVSVRRLYKVR